MAKLFRIQNIVNVSVEIAKQLLHICLVSGCEFRLQILRALDFWICTFLSQSEESKQQEYEMELH